MASRGGGKLYDGEKESFRYSLIGGCWHRKELGFHRIDLGTYRLSLVHSELEVRSHIEKFVLIDQVVTVLDL